MFGDKMEEEYSHKNCPLTSNCPMVRAFEPEQSPLKTSNGSAGYTAQSCMFSKTHFLGDNIVFELHKKLDR